VNTLPTNRSGSRHRPNSDAQEWQARAAKEKVGEETRISETTYSGQAER